MQLGQKRRKRKISIWAQSSAENLLGVCKNMKFTIDARKICAHLCIYERCKELLEVWIRDHDLKPGKDFVTDADGTHLLTSSAAQKIYMSHLLTTPR